MLMAAQAHRRPFELALDSSSDRSPCFAPDLGPGRKMEPDRARAAPRHRFRCSGAVHMCGGTALAVMGAPIRSYRMPVPCLCGFGQIADIRHLPAAVGAGTRSDAWSEACAAARARGLSASMLCLHVWSSKFDVVVCCRTHVANA